MKQLLDGDVVPFNILVHVHQHLALVVVLGACLHYNLVAGRQREVSALTGFEYQRVLASYVRIVPSPTITASPPTRTSSRTPPRLESAMEIRLGRPIRTPCRLTSREAVSDDTTLCWSRYAPSGPLAAPVAGSSGMPKPGANIRLYTVASSLAG